MLTRLALCTEINYMSMADFGLFCIIIQFTIANKTIINPYKYDQLKGDFIVAGFLCLSTTDK